MATVKPLIADYTYVEFSVDGKVYSVSFDEGAIEVEDLEEVFPEVMDLVLDRIQEFPSDHVHLTKLNDGRLHFKPREAKKRFSEFIDVECHNVIDISSLKFVRYLCKDVQLTDIGAFKYAGSGGTKIRFEREIKALMKFSNHPLVIQFLACVKEDERVIGFLTEYEGKGSIRGHLTSPDKDKWISQLVEVVKYLHDQGFAHGDIKTDNIVIGKDGNIRMIDFGGGFSEGYSPERRKYMPENMQDDVYSLGVTIWEISTGLDPRDGIEFDKMGNCKWRGFSERCVTGRDQGLRQCCI